MGFPSGSDSKESACNEGDLYLIPGLGRPPGGGHGNPLQYFCLENSTDRRACWATVHGVVSSWTRLSGFTFTHFHLYVPDTFRAQGQSFLVTTWGSCPFCYSHVLSSFLVFLVIKSERPRSTWYPPPLAAGHGFHVRLCILYLPAFPFSGGA